MEYLHTDLSARIIKAFYQVYNHLGHGFLEKVYENALFIELGNQQLRAVKQPEIQVFYHSHRVGQFYADIVVEDTIILELKAAKAILPEHEAQLLNYLRATPMEVGLLLNFGPSPQHIRRVFTNDRKVGVV